MARTRKKKIIEIKPIELKEEEITVPVPIDNNLEDEKDLKEDEKELKKVQHYDI